MRSPQTALVLVLVLVLFGASCSAGVDTAQSENAIEQVENQLDPDDPTSSDGESGDDAPGDPTTSSDSVDPVDVAGGETEANDVDVDVDETIESSTAECSVGATASTSTVLGALAGDLRDASADDLATRIDELAVSLDAPEPSPEALFSMIAIVPEVADVLGDQGQGGCFDRLVSAMARLGIAPDVATGTASDGASTDDDLASILTRSYDLLVEDADCVVGQLEAAGNDAPDDLAILVALSACENA